MMLLNSEKFFGFNQDRFFKESLKSYLSGLESNRSLEWIEQFHAKHGLKEIVFYVPYDFETN